MLKSCQKEPVVAADLSTGVCLYIMSKSSSLIFFNPLKQNQSIDFFYVIEAEIYGSSFCSLKSQVIELNNVVDFFKIFF